MQHIGPAASDINDPLLRRLYGYWNERRGTRAMPARADIDPLDMRFVLGYLLLIDVLREPRRFRVRLHGTELVRHAGYELTGKILDELPATQFRDLASKSFGLVAEERRPIHTMRDWILDNQVHRYESLILPLSAEGETVDMLLVGLRYTG